MRILPFCALLLVAACSSSQAPTAAGSADLTAAANGTVSFADFSKAVVEGQTIIPEGDGCTFDVVATADAVKLTITAGKDTLTLDVPSGARIARSGKSDGNANADHFAVDGVGTVDFLYVDDAYSTVTLADAGKKTATCEVDY